MSNADDMEFQGLDDLTETLTANVRTKKVAKQRMVNIRMSEADFLRLDDWCHRYRVSKTEALLHGFELYKMKIESGR